MHDPATTESRHECPHCRNALSDERYLLGKCPYCGTQFAEADPEVRRRWSDKRLAQSRQTIVAEWIATILGSILMLGSAAILIADNLGGSVISRRSLGIAVAIVTYWLYTLWDCHAHGGLPWKFLPLGVVCLILAILELLY